tara:strand:+ start:409 stop:609 length:201 start_codon:yes stop_codon:yes gene_type:complete
MYLIVDNNSGFPVTQDLLTTEAEAEKYKAEHCEDVDCVVVSESNYNEGVLSQTLSHDQHKEKSDER